MPFALLGMLTVAGAVAAAITFFQITSLPAASSSFSLEISQVFTNCHSSVAYSDCDNFGDHRAPSFFPGGCRNFDLDLSQPAKKPCASRSSNSPFAPLGRDAYMRLNSLPANFCPHASSG